MSDKSKKKISALVVVVVVVTRLLDAVFEVVVARHLLDAVVVVVAEITNSHPSPSPALSWGPSPRSFPSPSCPRPTESRRRLSGEGYVHPKVTTATESRRRLGEGSTDPKVTTINVRPKTSPILERPRSTIAAVPAYPRREGRRSPKKREAALRAQPPHSSRALPPSPGGSQTETQGWLQEEHGLQLLVFSSSSS